MRPPRRVLVTSLSISLLAAMAAAQTPYLVHDISVGPRYPWPYFGAKEASVGLDGVAHFFHDDGRHGRELWRSDGSPVGTYLIRDICPGSCGADASFSYGALARVGRRIFFVANDGVHGAELWATDGTAAGSSMVLDIRPGLFSSEAKWFRTAAGLLFFLANDGVHGEEIWRSDGTPAGTYMVRDIAVDPDALAIVAIQPGAGQLWMLVSGTEDTAGLWTTDGTAAGTVRVIDRYPIGSYGGTGKSSAIAALPGGVAVVQVSSPQPSVRELWRSDGTPAGTFKLRDLSNAGTAVVAAGGNAYIHDRLPGRNCPTLIQTDGTQAGTHEAALPANACVGLTYLAAPAGNRLLFALYTQVYDWEPWATDGQTATALGDLNPGPISSLASNDYYYWPGGAAVSSTEAVFAANDGSAAGLQLWVSDGTPAGTRRVSSFAPGYLPYSCPLRLAMYPLEAVGHGFYLPCFDDSAGSVLWRADLTTGTATEVAPLGGTASGLTPRLLEDAMAVQTPPTCFEKVGQRLLYSSRGADWMYRLLSTDGSVGGLELLGSSPLTSWNCAAGANHAVTFESGNSDETTGFRLTNALPEGTGSLFAPGAIAPALSFEPPVISLGDRWILGSSNELWSSDGSLAGSISIASPGDTSCSPHHVARGDEIALFGCREVRAYSTATGTTPILHDFGVDGQLRDALSTKVGFAMLAVDAAHGLELWWTDGTPEGTLLARDINPGPRAAFPAELGEVFRFRSPRLAGRLAPLGSRILFAADDGVHGEELWVSDGTEAGTVLLGDLYPGSYPSTPRELVAAGDRVYFVAEHPWLGRELWITDGTADGTRVQVDLVAGAESSRPGDLAFLDGELYFSAWTPTYGREVWRTDGATKLTLRLTDIAPGSQSSSPGLFRRIGARLFFAADDGLHGSELWAISDDGTVPLFHDDAESGTLLRWDAAQI